MATHGSFLICLLTLVRGDGSLFFICWTLFLYFSFCSFFVSLAEAVVLQFVLKTLSGFSSYPHTASPKTHIAVAKMYSYIVTLTSMTAARLIPYFNVIFVCIFISYFVIFGYYT